MALTDLLHDWHDFYVLAGTAAATLVGLMFVAASIGASVFNESNRSGVRAFLSPTVVHFSAVLVISLMITVPVHQWSALGAILGVGGLAGTIYSGAILAHIVIGRNYRVGLIDRMFYALIPVVGYGLVLVAAILLFLQSALGTVAIAGAVLILLLAGIRNAWDMTMWAAIRAPTSDAGAAAPPPRAPGQ
jgi:hypothetical protein